MTNYLNNSYRYSDFRPRENAHGSMQKTKSTSKKQDEKIDKTLEGVLLNTYIKDGEKSVDMDDICNSLIIPDSFEKNSVCDDINDKKDSKETPLLVRALPCVASALLAAGMLTIVSNSYLKSQKFLNSENVPTGVKLPIVGKNINLRSEEYFAIYMAISEPKTKNVLALLGVLAASAFTFIGKTFIDGVKKVWLKKQEADIKKNFEENVINIETKSFSGKLDVVRNELVEKTKYFKEKLSSFDESPKKNQDRITPETSAFGKFLNLNSSSIIKTPFKGNSEENKTESKTQTETKKEESFFDKFKNSPLGLLVVSVGVLGIMALSAKKVFNNMAQSEKTRKAALDASIEKIRTSIKDVIENFKNASDDKEKEKLLGSVKEKLLSVMADKDEIQETLTKLGLDNDVVQKTTDELTNEISKLKYGEKFYVQADPAMGGKEGTQFYIYIDQAKGYIYDVITHPENKFARYLFSAIAATGATGYVLKESIDAIKEAMVMRENSNTELELQRKLVSTEIKNFKSKKESAIAPLMNEFDTKLKEGKSKEELKVMADNILLEIKNGPPFVYA